MEALLTHLPEPPADFRAKCKNATTPAELAYLAQFRLDGAQLEQLNKARLRIGGNAGASFRLGVISNSTTDFLPAAFGGTGLRYGLNIEAIVGEYGQIAQEAFNPESAINARRCDAVLLAIDHRGLALDGARSAERVGAALDQLIATSRALKKHNDTLVIFQTVPVPASPLFGSMDSVIGGNIRSATQQFNIALRQLVSESSGDLLLDVELLASTIGLRQWHSPAQWNVAKLPFAQQALPVYAEHLARLLAAVRGKSRKCLVLDLDNTCWGGAIGDVGMEGIALGQGNALGEAFLEVQRTALALRDRGVLLAVCSKNDHANAIQPFREHPDMLLREEHISAFQANWIDKATNIEVIAKLLNIGLDSLVLLDDNPAERIQVRTSLPMVAVPELPDDPSEYPSILLNAGYFEAVSLTAEDADRSAQYRANTLRTELLATTRDPHAYLSALEMKITFASFDKLNRSRITQLINKTNQFNLTTRRYTEAEVEAMESDSGIWTMQVRLVDKFGDNGMISCVVCKPAGTDTWEIDTWLMSCRVLARRVEDITMLKVIEHARRKSIKRLVGAYIPTAKNEMVREFYGKLGFKKIDDKSGHTLWGIDTYAAELEAPPMQVHDLLL